MVVVTKRNRMGHHSQFEVFCLVPSLYCDKRFSYKDGRVMKLQISNIYLHIYVLE